MRTFQPPAIADESRLSTDDLDRLRHRLVAESATHAARHAEHLAMAGRLRELTDPDSVLERELAEGGAVRAEEAMADIEDALRRIHTGTYGSCEACGTAIALERLEAIPSARCCVGCPGRRPGWARRVAARLGMR